MVVFIPIIVPGFNTLLHPTSTLSPRKAPTFFKLVFNLSIPLMNTMLLSLFKLEVIAPAPKWALYPIIESPT